MTKKLHYILLALFAAVFNTAMAQEVTLDFTENTWGLPNGSSEKLVDAANYTSGSYTITLQGSEGGGYYHNATWQYLLFGKAGATLTLPAFDFDVEKIAITGTSGASAAVKQNIFVGDTEVSTETTGAKEVTNEYAIAEAYQKAGTVYQLKVLSAHNTQVSKIEIYKKGTSGPTKTQPEMAFNPTAVTVTIGESVTPPTLTYTGNGAVTYTSSHEDVATVNASTGAITVVAVGSTTITATAAETDTYKSASAHYTLLVKNESIVITDAIWSENWDSSEAGTLVEDVANATASYHGDGNYVKLYANSNDPTNIELLVPKSSRGVAFSADINLQGKSGNLTLSYYSNRPLSVTSTTSGVAISEATADSNTYTHNVTIPGGVEQLNLTFSTTTDANARLDEIVLAVSDNQNVKTKPDMRFSSETVNITFGETVTAPTLTYNGDGTVTYTSSNEQVATVDASTGALTVLAVGSATITANATETDKFLGATAQYKLTVTAAESGEAIWSENWDTSEAGTLVEDVANANATYHGDGNYVKLYANSNDESNIELLVPKSSRGVAFSADINLQGKSGNLTLSYYANRALDVTSTTSGVAISDATAADNNYTHTITVAGGTEQLNLTFSTKTDANARIDNIKLMASDGEAKLTISGTTPFKNSTTVTITPSNEDYAVYYTTDGTDPGTSDTKKVYSAPFQLTATTTVKAVEEDYGGELSAVVEKTFVLEEAPDLNTVANIAEFKALADGTEATLTLTNAQVLYAGTADIYVRDASGAIDFYNTGLNLTTGQILNGSVVGKRATYNNIPELAKSDNTNSNSITATNGTATPIKLTVAQAKDEQYYCNLIRIEGVKVEAKQEGNYTNYYAYVGEESILIYDRFKVGMGDWNENDTYNVEGILVPFKGAFEIYLTQPLAGGTTPPDTGITVCNNIAEFKALSNGTEAELKLNNAQVVYVSGNDVYVRDASGAIEFYNTGITFEANQVLNGSITGKYSPYRNLPELAKTNDTNADKLTITEGSAAVPHSVSVAQLNTNEYLCDLILLENAIVAEEEGKLYATAGDSRVLIYDKFKVVGEDLVAGATVTITGIASIFNNDYQLLPISYTLSSGIRQLTTDSFDPAMPVYNTAGQQVDASYKGIVIQKGRKFILK